MRSDLNLNFIRACAAKLGATDEKIKELEKDQHKGSGEWDDEQAARLWKASPHEYIKPLGLSKPAELKRGDRVLNPNDMYIARPWTIAACGDKRVTLEREEHTIGS